MNGNCKFNDKVSKIGSLNYVLWFFMMTIITQDARSVVFLRSVSFDVVFFITMDALTHHL